MASEWYAVAFNESERPGLRRRDAFTCSPDSAVPYEHACPLLMLPPRLAAAQPSHQQSLRQSQSLRVASFPQIAMQHLQQQRMPRRLHLAHFSPLQMPMGLPRHHSVHRRPGRRRLRIPSSSSLRPFCQRTRAPRLPRRSPSSRLYRGRHSGRRRMPRRSRRARHGKTCCLSLQVTGGGGSGSFPQRVSVALAGLPSWHSR